MDANYGGSAYSVGGGFFRSPYEEARRKEKESIRTAGNGIGLAALGYIALSFFTGTIYAMLAEMFYPAALLRGTAYVPETVEWVMSMLIYTVTLILPFGIYALCIKIPPQVAAPFRKAKLGLTIGGVFIGLGASVLASYATSYLQSFFGNFGVGLEMPEYVLPQTAAGTVLYLISMVLLPAFVEEIVFRGIVMQSLRRFGDLFALVTSALVFGIFHLNPIQMPYAFIVGLFMGYFVMRSGSLWAGVLIHFFNNAVAAAFEMLTPGMTEEQLTMLNVYYDLITVILAGIAVCLLLMKYRDMFRFGPSGNILPPGERTKVFVTSPGLILSMIAAVFLTLEYVYFM